MIINDRDGVHELRMLIIEVMMSPSFSFFTHDASIGVLVCLVYPFWTCWVLCIGPLLIQKINVLSLPMDHTVQLMSEVT